MSLWSRFKRIKYGSYKDSKNASVYERLALKHNVSPQHVYEIAHGKKTHSSSDRNVFDELVFIGIIEIAPRKV